MKNIYGLIILLFALASCVGPKYAEPTYTVEESYKSYMHDTLVSNTDTIFNLQWWKFFDDPQLDTLVQYALEYNKDVLMAASRIEQSRAILGMTKADQWPSFSYGGGASYGNSDKLTSSNLNGAVNMNWELVFWGRYRAAAEGARAELASSEYGYRSIQISLITSVAQSYFVILDLENRLRISEQTLGSRDSAVFIMDTRFKGGVIPEIDLNQAQINQAIAAGSVPYYQRKLALARNSLSILIGVHPRQFTFTEELDDVQLNIDIPYGMPSALLLRRPDILASREAYHAQFKQINVAVAQRLPSISITGAFGGSSAALGAITTTGLAWSAGSSLLGPLFQFGKNKRRVDMERARAQEMLIQYEFTVLQSFREVEDALISIKTLKVETKAKEAEAIAAMNAERLSKMRYDKGVSSYLEVLDNQRSSFDAQLGLSQLKQELLDSYINLYRALGGGWISAEEEQQAKEEASKQGDETR